MSFVTDMLFPPWTRGLFLGPLGRLLVEEFKRFSHGGHELFGTGEQPNLPAPPPPPGPAPQTGGRGPTQDEIDKLNDTINKMQQEIKELHDAATHASEQSGANSDDGRRTNDRILRNGSDLGGALAPQGSTPEAESGRLAAMQQQIDALTKNVQDKANNANGIADALRNMGMSPLGMGMPGMGMPGMGMPALGGLGGLGAPGMSPLGGPAVTAHPADELKPPKVTATDKDPLAAPKVTTPADQAPPAAPSTAPGTQPASPPPAAPAAPGAAAQPSNNPAPPPAPESKDITLPSGQVVTAPNPAAAKAVRTAINQPAGKGDVATTAYAGTGVDIPTDGADPGRKIDPSDLQPGDIAVFDDHTAIVAGNGQLVGPDGKLQPLGVINDMPGFNGFYRPTEPADTAAPPTGPPPAAPSDHDRATTLASPPPTTTDNQAVSPGFGLPPRAPQHVG